MLTLLPATPEAGENDVTFGSTVRLPALMVVPPALVMLIGPVVAAVGTVALIWVLLTGVMVPLTPLNLIALVPLKLSPLMVMTVPAVAWSGVKLLMVGVILSWVALLVPAGVVTVMLLVRAAAGMWVSMPVAVLVLMGRTVVPS